MKVGRNAPCPCGSGKKYKHCCLKKEQESRARVREMTGGMPMANRFFGYDREARTPEERVTVSEVGLVCMVARIDAGNIQMARRDTGLDFRLGDWFVSTGAHQHTKVYGPFYELEAAFEFAREEAGAIRMVAEPVFDL